MVGFQKNKLFLLFSSLFVRTFVCFVCCLLLLPNKLQSQTLLSLKSFNETISTESLQRNEQVAHHQQLLDKNQLTPQTFASQLIPPQEKVASQDLYFLSTRTIFSIKAPIDEFKADVLLDPDFLNTGLKKNMRLSELNSKKGDTTRLYKLNSTNRFRPSHNIKVSALNSRQLAQSKVGKHLLENTKFLGQPTIAIQTSRSNYSKSMGLKTAHSAYNYTLFFESTNNQSTVAHFTVVILHTVKFGPFGGKDKIFESTEEATLFLVDSMRDYFE